MHAKVNTGLSKIEPIDEQSELKRNTKEHEGQQQKLGADMHGIANQHYKLDPVVGGMNYETLSYLFERTSQPFYNNAAQANLMTAAAAHFGSEKYHQATAIV